MPPTASPRLSGLDTLRATAILLVMVFHLQPYLPPVLGHVASVGWMGVDLFFVLSGYLIGLQLLRPYAHGERLRLSDFYLRRAYRILPAYLVVVLLYFAIPAWREQPGLSPAWKLLTFTENLRLDYPEDLAFSHVWSLCVEEHFYLLLPLLVVGLMRKPSAVRTAGVIAAIVVFGIGVRGWALFHVVRVADEDRQWILFMKRIYYPTYCRLDGLVAGVTLAILRVFRARWWSALAGRGNALLVCGLLVSGVAVWLFRGAYPGADDTAGVLIGFPVLSLGFSLLVAAAVAENGPLRRRVVGAETLATLAFSLYMTHKAVAHVDRLVLPWMEEDRGWLAAAIYAASCMMVAGALYWMVERPFLRVRGRRLERGRLEVEARENPAL